MEYDGLISVSNTLRMETTKAYNLTSWLKEICVRKVTTTPSVHSYVNLFFDLRALLHIVREKLPVLTMDKYLYPSSYEATPVRLYIHLALRKKN